MAPVRVRGCVGFSEPPGTPGSSSGKPMPGAGETAHVRRLFVDRSRCALEVSPAPRRVPMSLMTGRRAVVADKSGDTLSRRMWGRRPGRPDGWHTGVRGSVAPGANAPGARTPTRLRRAVPNRASVPEPPSVRIDPSLRDGLSGRAAPSLVSPPGGKITPCGTKVLSPSSGASGNRVLGARDDPASDGYTHFQPSRAPEKNGAQAERG